MYYIGVAVCFKFISNYIESAYIFKKYQICVEKKEYFNFQTSAMLLWNFTFLFTFYTLGTYIQLRPNNWFYVLFI